MNIFSTEQSKFSHEPLSNNRVGEAQDDQALREEAIDCNGVSRLGVWSPVPYVRDYVRRGWHVLPLAQREKVPAKGWSWTKTAVTEAGG
jgi:hypothetical protein